MLRKECGLGMCRETHKGNKETKIGGDVELYVVSRRVS